MPRIIQFGNFAELVAAWAIIYAQAAEIEELADKGGADWESLCVGWCLGRGLTVIEAHEFYRLMIPLKLF